MPPKSGIGADFGYAAETTYGQVATPNRFVRFSDETLDWTPEYDEDEELAAGLLGMEEGQSALTTSTVAGSVTLSPASKGLIGLLNPLTGNTVTPSGSGAAKTWLFPVGLTAPDGKTLTAQVGVPDLGGTVRPKTVVGLAIQSAEFSMEIGKSMKAKFDLVGRDMNFTTALANPVYPTGFERFGYRGSTFTIDGAAPSGKVRTASVKIDLPRETGRYGMDGTGLADEAVTNAKVKVSGQVQMEFMTLAEANAFRANTHRPARWRNLGTKDIETGIKPELTFDFASIKTKGGIPKVAGPGIVLLDLPFDAYISPASDPLVVIKAITSDTAL